MQKCCNHSKTNSTIAGIQFRSITYTLLIIFAIHGLLNAADITPQELSENTRIFLSKTTRPHQANMTPLQQAATQGDLTLVQHLLQEKHDPNERCILKLCNCIGQQLIRVARSLICARSQHRVLFFRSLAAPLFLRDFTQEEQETANHAMRSLNSRICSATSRSHGGTSLHLAAKQNHVPVVVCLLNAGANTELEDALGNTAAHYAARSGSTEVLEVLTERGADLKYCNSFNETPATLAADNDRLNTLRKLRELGKADTEMLERRSLTGANVLHRAAQRGNTDIIAQLLSWDVNCEIQNNAGSTALHRAARHGKVDAIRSLIAAGAIVDARNACAETPLEHAVQSGALNCIQLLVSAGADFMAKKNDEYTLLHSAVVTKRDPSKVIRYILEHPEGATLLHVRDKHQRTPIELANQFDLIDARNAIERYITEHPELDQ